MENNEIWYNDSLEQLFRDTKFQFLNFVLDLIFFLQFAISKV